jgi:AraC-like DNA-binding protein
MSTDTLSEVLRAVRLTGVVFFSVDASSPWVAEAPPARELGVHIMPGVEHVIEYHVVKSGTCWAGVVDEEPVLVEAGDVIVFPQGDAHVLSSKPGMRGAAESVSARTPPARLPIAIKKDGGGPEHAQLICGFLGCDVRPFNPLLGVLPRMIHIPRRAADGVFSNLVALALAESEAGREGSEVVLARLSELLFVEVVRSYLATLPPEQRGWLAGLRDAQVGRALGKLHDDPARNWTLDDLAREIGMSRSMLAEDFAHFVGVPPMQYLAQWRMQIAATLLSTTTLGLGEIAARVGYGSEAALSRAYKRLVGVAPADWRRGKRGDVATSS